MSSLTENDSDVLDRLARRLPHLRHVLAQPTDQPLRGFESLDSIDLVELLCAVESEFGVRLSDDDLTGAETVGKLVELIESRINQPDRRISS